MVGNVQLGGLVKVFFQPVLSDFLTEHPLLRATTLFLLLAFVTTNDGLFHSISKLL